jgi:hypothetical protein
LQYVKLSRSLAVLGMLAFVTAACSTPTGTITGHLFMVGGPGPGIHSPMLGTIYVSGHGTVDAGPDGSFSVTVPAGTYTLSGRTPDMNGGKFPCHASHSVTVHTGTLVKIDVICNIR